MLSKIFTAITGKRIFIGAGIVILALLSFLWWKNGNLQETIGGLQSEKSQLKESLETTRNSVYTLKAQMDLSDEIVKSQREKRSQLTEQIDSLEQALESEKQNNPQLQECLSVELPEFSEKLREQTGFSDEGEK